MTGCSGPNTSPFATKFTRLYPICPAAPVTRTCNTNLTSSSSGNSCKGERTFFGAGAMLGCGVRAWWEVRGCLLPCECSEAGGGGWQGLE